MILAQVCGNVVATHHEKGFHAHPLRIVVKVFDMTDPVPQGDPFVVLDRMGVCEGEFVLLETAMEAGMGLNGRVACDAAIVAIVDKVVG